MLTKVKTKTYLYFVDELGRKQGEFKSWYRNGQIRLDCYLVDNLYSGEYKEWYENGQIAAHYFTVDHKFHGEYKQWNENGRIAVHRFFINGDSVTFKSLGYRNTPESRMYIKLKYNLPLLT